MGFWSAIVAIMAIIACMEILKARYHAQAGIIQDNAGNQQMVTRPADGDVQREIADLRQRLEVLERIATDANSLHGRNASDIAREIESLRG